MKPATPAKLKNGSWGARVEGTVAIGETIQITTKAGKTWEARVSQVVWSGDDVSLVATETRSRSSGRGSGRRRGRGQAALVAGYSSYCTDDTACRCYDCAS